MDLDDDAATCGRVAALWRSVMPTAGEIRRARRRLHLKACFILAIVAASYWGLVITDGRLLVRFGCAAVLVTGLIAVATSIMHDANHGSFSRWAWLNRCVSYSADALGTSSWLWKFKHNTLHHGNTNVVGVDGDISQAPFARLAPGQPWRRWHRAQHIYMWPLYGFMALKNLVIGDFVSLASQRRGPVRRRANAAAAVRLVSGKIVHVGWALALPLLFNPWWAVMAFYVACSWLVGFVLAVTFQLAHCVEGVEFPGQDVPRRGEGFTRHQLLTTTNIDSHVPVVGHLFRWLVGGLDHQIEHHLAPRVPHTAYAAVGRRFRAGCSEIGVVYRQHSGVVSAIRSHARWLKQMGQPVIFPCSIAAVPR